MVLGRRNVKNNRHDDLPMKSALLKSAWVWPVLFGIVGILLLLQFATPLRIIDVIAKRPKTQLMVSVAASLTDAIKDIDVAYTKLHPNVELVISAVSSGQAQRQIEQGAPVDVFVSASEKVMQALVAGEFVAEDDVVVVATNQLVLVAPEKGGPAGRAPASWQDLARMQRIAIGNPEHVPAGEYGQAVLTSLGLWNDLRNKLILGEDVRQVCSYVASGEVDAGIVYESDTYGVAGIKLIVRAPAGSHPPIRYPAAALRESRQRRAAQALVNYLKSAEGQNILKRYGFSSPAD